MLFMPNTPEFAISFYGVLKAGGTVTAANPLSGKTELEFQMRDSGAETIVIAENLLESSEEIVSRLDPDRVVVVGNDRRGFRLFSEMTSFSEFAKLPRIDPHEDIAVLQYTGGTTGMPKGAMMTHFNLAANAIQNATWFGWRPGETVMGILPFYHTWGSNVCLNSPAFTGCTVVLMEKFDASEALALVEKRRVNIMYGSATMFNMLLQEPGIEKRDLSSLRYVKAGAMPVPDELRKRWDKTTGIPLILGYGLSEASPETHDSPLGRVKSNSIGIPLIDTDARIVDAESEENELKPGETGELLIRGPQVMKGYWRQPEGETGSVRNGWLHTGDIAEMDTEGYFYIRDRKKDLIKYKGYSIAPAEVENILYRHPAVLECAVIGKPHPAFGETPKAFVVCRDGTGTDAPELMEFCNCRISPYKKIREIEFIESIPKNTVGKILRRVLRQRDKNSGCQK